LVGVVTGDGEGEGEGGESLYLAARDKYSAERLLCLGQGTFGTANAGKHDAATILDVKEFVSQNDARVPRKVWTKLTFLWARCAPKCPRAMLIPPSWTSSPRTTIDRIDIIAKQYIRWLAYKQV
jgi:hypothetical protein